MVNTEKKEKRKYTKPMVRVVQWDFNEAVCDTIYKCTYCIRIDGPEGSSTRVDARHTFNEGSISWTDWDGNGSK